jgi:subtilisin
VGRIAWRSVLSALCLACAVVGVAVSAASGSGATGGAVPGQYIVVLKPGADRAAAIAQARSLGGDVFLQYQYALNGFAVRLPEAAISGIERNPNVLLVEPDGAVQAFAPVDASTQVLAFAIDRIDGDLSSTRSGDGRGSVPINVAVLDTGIQPDHPDLNVVGGTDCVSPRTSFADDQGHGTFVAGLVGALDNDFGQVGVAPGARLWAIRVLGKNETGSTVEVICGIDWVTSTRSDGDPSNDIAVANMSVGAKRTDDSGACGSGHISAMHIAICGSVAAGVTYVVAAANDTADIQTVEPAAFDEVLTATAMRDIDGQPGGLGDPAKSCRPPPFEGADDTPASFSNFATLAADQAHTLAAPGVCVASTFINSLYAVDSGTSFASPLIAGTVALCIFSGPCAGLTPSQIIQKIVADAAAYNTSKKGTGYGFQGDPLHPISGKYYGFLIRAGLY